MSYQIFLHDKILYDSQLVLPENINILQLQWFWMQFFEIVFERDSFSFICKKKSFLMLQTVLVYYEIKNDLNSFWTHWHSYKIHSRTFKTIRSVTRYKLIHLKSTLKHVIIILLFRWNFSRSTGRKK